MCATSDTPLGKTIPFPEKYAPQLLFPISRAESRTAIGLSDCLPFNGFDQWVCYEVSWLSPDGMPCAAVGRISYPCNSDAMVESKSLKLFLGSLNNQVFESSLDVGLVVKSDLERVLGTDSIAVDLMPLSDWAKMAKLERYGECLEQSVVGGFPLLTEPASKIIKAYSDVVEESLYSDVFRALCPVTGQPDWATVEIAYAGACLDKASLLSYLLSFRNFRAFHEDCCERIFLHIRDAQLAAGAFDKLMVTCRFLRRGGIDLSPVRFTENMAISHIDFSIR